MLLNAETCCRNCRRCSWIASLTLHCTLFKISKLFNYIHYDIFISLLPCHYYSSLQVIKKDILSFFGVECLYYYYVFLYRKFCTCVAGLLPASYGNIQFVLFNYLIFGLLFWLCQEAYFCVIVPLGILFQFPLYFPSCLLILSQRTQQLLLLSSPSSLFKGRLFRPQEGCIYLIFHLISLSFVAQRACYVNFIYFFTT